MAFDTFTDDQLELIIAEAKELLRNAQYQDGIARCLTQDCEALEKALGIGEDD